MAIFDDLEAEQERLAGILAALDEGQWGAESGAEGWTVADVVLHLAQSEEAVSASVASGGGAEAGPSLGPVLSGRAAGAGVDEVAAQAVQAERAAADQVLRRWQRARAASLAAL